MRILLASALGALALTLLALVTARSDAEAATPTGLDVSWPQCGKRLPATPLAFAVVGVDGGRAFTTNPCLGQQYQWAGSTGTLPALYLTLRSPQGSTAARGLDGPAGRCLPSDAHCVGRNYGYRTAEAARAYAQQQVGPPPATMWWLDIETMSYWSTDQAANAQVVQGAIDYLYEQGALFGVYSTRAQWNQITGGMALPAGLPIWIAGARDGVDAPTLCTPRYAFGGGQLWLVQYIANDLDHNHVCGDPMSVTILTRSITSATAAMSTALRATPIEAAPPAHAPERSAEPLPVAPARPLELAHVGGAGLVTLPAVGESPRRAGDCANAPSEVTRRGGAASTLGGDADRPRHGHSARRRREA